MHDSSNTVGMFGVFFGGEGAFNAIFSLYKHQEQTNRNKETMKEPPRGVRGGPLSAGVVLFAPIRN